MVNKDFRAFVSRRFKQFKMDKGYRSEEELLNDINKQGKEISHSISDSGLNKIMRGASSPQLETLYCFCRIGLSIDYLITGKTPNNDPDFEEFKIEFKRMINNFQREAGPAKRDIVIQILKLINSIILKD